MEELDMNIDHKVLAKHFGHSNEAMRQLKRKWEFQGKGAWVTYVKAYFYDMEMKNGKEV